MSQVPRGRGRARQIGAYVAREGEAGLRLTRARAKRGLTQSEVGEQLGISRAHVSNVEAGRSSIPGERLVLWATVYGVSISSLAKALYADFYAGKQRSIR